jgi:hypothetical protein
MTKVYMNEGTRSAEAENAAVMNICIFYLFEGIVGPINQQCPPIPMGAI